MNKKADVEISKLIVLLLAVMALLAVGIFFYKTWSDSTNQINNIGKSIKPDSNLFNLNDKSFSLKEKERCAELSSNPNRCMGIGKEKTGCFWGKTVNGIGCYSCKNNQYFGDEYGKCKGYSKVISALDETEAKEICEFDPCSFVSRESDKCSIQIGKTNNKISSLDCGTVTQNL